MLRRMSASRRALIRKLENIDAFPMIALQAIRELRKDLDAVEAEAIIRARELGASFEDIAEAMEITRQGVAYRLKALAGESHDDPVDQTEEIVDIRGSEADAQAPRQDP
jgi:hypothetical protein